MRGEPGNEAKARLFVPLCACIDEMNALSAGHTSVKFWAVTGVAIAAVLVLLAVTVVQSAAIWHQRR